MTFMISPKQFKCIDENSFKYINTIEFRNSLCIIRKEHPVQNTIGERLISGEKAMIRKEELLDIKHKNQYKEHFDIDSLANRPQTEGRA